MNVILRVSYLSIVCAFCACDAGDNTPNTPQLTTKCDTWENVLSKSSNGVVLVIEEGCSGWVNENWTSIDVTPTNGKRLTVFRFADVSWDPTYHNQTTPTAEWIGEKRLKIHIGAVGVIDKQLDRAGDISIEYEIEHVVK